MTRLALALCLAPGCGPAVGHEGALDDPAPAGDQDPLADDSGAPAPGCTDCALADANNYAYSAGLMVATRPGLAGAGDRLVVDWSGLETDIHGHVRGVDFEIEEVLLLVFLDLSPDEIRTGIATDSLPQSDVALYASCPATESRCALSDFGVLGRDVDLEEYYDEGRGTWMALLRSSAEAGAHAMVFFPPDPAGTTEVVVDDSASALEVDVDLAALAPVWLAPDADGPHRLDWSGLTRDGIGNPLAPHTLSRLLLARYDQPVSALEQRVFDLERIATETWELPISGTVSAELDALVGGELAARVAADETWLVALYCESCTNPAPKFVTRLAAEAP